jgi:hypothetical protein
MTNDDRQPLERPLRLKSKYKWMENREFPVDDQGTKKLLRDCTEEDRQFIVDSGSDNIFAREQPRNYRAEAAAWEQLEPDVDAALHAVNLDEPEDRP